MRDLKLGGCIPSIMLYKFNLIDLEVLQFLCMKQIIFAVVTRSSITTTPDTQAATQKWWQWCQNIENFVRTNMAKIALNIQLDTSDTVRAYLVLSFTIFHFLYIMIFCSVCVWSKKKLRCYIDYYQPHYVHHHQNS